MGNKTTNAMADISSSVNNAMPSGLQSADGPEAEARKRKEIEDAQAQAQAQAAGQESNVWASMGMDAMGGLKSGATDAYNAIMKKK
jgi:hypothetical protein